METSLRSEGAALITFPTARLIGPVIDMTGQGLRIPKYGIIIFWGEED
jgi:hypothetical protein